MDIRAQAIPPIGLALSGVMILAILFLMKIEKVPLKKDILIGALRTIGQLLLVGTLLQYVFQAHQWYWVTGVFIDDGIGGRLHRISRREARQTVFAFSAPGFIFTPEHRDNPVLRYPSYRCGSSLVSPSIFNPTGGDDYR